MDGEPHDSIERAFQSGDGGIAYPFLDAIGAGFVKRLVIIYVIIYFLFGKMLESDKGEVRECFFAGIAADCHGGQDFMRFA